jgi:retinol dehydrogenase 12
LASRANFRERSAPDIFAALSDVTSKYQADRYNTSKLLEIMFVRELSQNTITSDKPLVIINTVNPGYCISQLQRHATPVLYFFIKLGGLILARTTEAGSRTLFAGAVAGKESHGMYMSDCKLKEPSAFVRSADGVKTQKNVYEQLLKLLESIEPGISKNV